MTPVAVPPTVHPEINYAALSGYGYYAGPFGYPGATFDDEGYPITPTAHPIPPEERLVIKAIRAGKAAVIAPDPTSTSFIQHLQQSDGDMVEKAIRAAWAVLRDGWPIEEEG